MIVIRFVQGGGWDSKVIQWDTHCRYSHVEALLPDQPGVTLGAMLKGGVKIRSFSDPVYKNAIGYKVVSIKCTPEQEKKFYDFLRSQIGKDYDWQAIVNFGLWERHWRDPDDWFCSELIVRAFEEAGMLYVPDDFPAWVITPRDCCMLVGVESEIVLDKAA